MVYLPILLGDERHEKLVLSFAIKISYLGHDILYTRGRSRSERMITHMQNIVVRLCGKSGNSMINTIHK